MHGNDTSVTHLHGGSVIDRHTVNNKSANMVNAVNLASELQKVREKVIEYERENKELQSLLNDEGNKLD